MKPINLAKHGVNSVNTSETPSHTLDKLPPKQALRMEYCTQCQWMLRTTWMAQELLNTFGNEIDELTLCPSTGGTFKITAIDTVIWDRTVDGGFPDIKILKQRVRDVIAPERGLGHLDT